MLKSRVTQWLVIIALLAFCWGVAWLDPQTRQAFYHANQGLVEAWTQMRAAFR
jgi:hypothetical protein